MSSIALADVIQTEEENERWTAVLEALNSHSSDLSVEEKRIAEILTLLIEDFEGQNLPPPKCRNHGHKGYTRHRDIRAMTFFTVR